MVIHENAILGHFKPFQTNFFHLYRRGGVRSGTNHPPLFVAISQICTFFCQICTFFFLPKSCQICTFFCQICTFFLCDAKRIFCCKISLNWVRLGLGPPQGLEKPPARARKAPCKGQDSNLSYFMVKKGADLTTFSWGKRCRFDKKGADLTTF